MGIACLFGHKWNGCRCKRCGIIRDYSHEFQPVAGKCTERCAACGKEKPLPHQWNGCQCARCGAHRDTGHDWNGCTCRICGTIREEGHDWDGCTCRICRKIREEGHDWKDGKCLRCRRKHAPHTFINGICTVCGLDEDSAVIAEIKADYRQNIERQLDRIRNSETLITLITSRCLQTEDHLKAVISRITGDDRLNQMSNDPENAFDLDDIWIAGIRVYGYRWQLAALLRDQVRDRKKLVPLVYEGLNYTSKNLIIEGIRDDAALAQIAAAKEIGYDLRCAARERIKDDQLRSAVRVERTPSEEAAYESDIRAGL